MKKSIVIILLFLLTHICAKAQYSSYSRYDNVESTVFEVEDMSSNEIKTFNTWVNSGIKKETALLMLNAGRAKSNLMAAPATIIDIHYDGEVTEEDSIPDAIGAAHIYIELINSTTKKIKTITFEFEFENYGTQVFDIKTGDKYCVLSFENLSGRTKSNRYLDIVGNLLKCYHILDFKKATKKKLFYNRKATTIKLHSVKIKYTDGTSSNKVAIFDKGYLHNDKITSDGPLAPFVNILNKEK